MTTASAGAVGVIVTANTAEFDSSMSKVGATAEREFQKVSKANAAAKKDGDAFIATLQRQVDTFGLTGTQLQQYTAKLKGVEDQATPLIAKLEAMRAAQAAIGATSSSGLGSTASAMGDVASGADKASHATAGITREMIVLAHELSQGNFKKLGGSLIVFAEFGAAGVAALAAVAPFVAVAAAVGAVALAAVKGAIEQEAFAKSLQISGNYAGQTASSFEALVKSVNAAAGGSLSGARDALQGLVSSGEVGPRVLAQMGIAVDLVAQKTGEDTDKIVKDFAKMAESPAKWAAEHNKAWNFVSADQYAYIKLLEEQGNKEQAELVVSKAVADHFSNTLAPNLGYIETGWKAVKKAAGEAWDAMANLGKSQTVDQQLESVDKQLQILAARRSMNILAGTPDANPGDDKQMAALSGKRSGLLQDKQLDNQNAWLKSYGAATAKAGMEADDFLAKLDKESKGASNLTKAMDELHKQQAAYNASHSVQLTPEQIKTQEDQTRALNTPKTKADHSQSNLDGAYTRELNSLGEQGAKLAAQADSIAKYGKALDATTAETEAFNIAQGKLVGTNGAALTQSQKMALLAQAAENDAAKEANAAVAASNAIGDKVKAMNSEATARDQSARQMFIAQQLSDKELDNLKKSPAAYAAATVAISAAAGNLFDQKTVKPAFDQWEKNIDDSIAKMAEETDSLTLSDVQRKKNNADLILEAQYRALVLKYPEQQAALQDKLTDAIAKTNAEIERNNTVSKSFGTGAQTALQKYQDDAANSAKYAEDFVGGSLSHLTDSLVTFAETGKLSFSGLFQFMADEFIRQQARMLVASATTGGSSGSGWLGSLLGIAGSFFGGGTGEGMGAGSAYANTNLPTAGGMAAGGPVDPGAAYLVGERGPEILRMGNVGGNIIPNGGGNAANDGAIHISQTLNIGQGVSRAEVSAALSANNAQLKNELARQKSRQTLLYAQ